MRIRVFTGDCRELLAGFDPESMHACVTDPPYHLTAASRRGSHRSNLPDNAYGRHRTGGEAERGFMGKTWDGGDVAFRPETWAEVLRVLKPGAHLLAFGGTRTYHRMACAVEDAGFEVRDQIGWIYGSGFPKSHNLRGAWDGWGTALKPAWEPIVVARKPFRGSVQANADAHGTGAFNIDACRIGDEERVSRTRDFTPMHGNRFGDPTVTDKGAKLDERVYVGRWPANIVHDGSDEVLDAFPEAPGQMAPLSLNPESRKSKRVYGVLRRGRAGEPSADSQNEGIVGFSMRPGVRRVDEGSAARFFYCAKATTAERGEGNIHPTVKPVALMRHLIQLVTPPHGVVLDPFAGSGSTGLAASQLGLDAVLLELDPEHARIARDRIQRYSPLFTEVA